MKLQTLHLRRADETRRAVFAVVSESDLARYETDATPLLSATEQAQLAGMQFAPKRQSFLLGRLAAKTALGAVLGEPNLPSIEIPSGVFGQPLVRHPRALGLEVTLSHSHGLAVALAFPSAWPIGIDLETVAPEVAATLLSAMNLSEAEQHWYAAAVGASPAAALNLASACGVLWGAREALGKAMKTAVNSPLGVLSACDIEPADGDATGTALGAALGPAPGTAWCGGYTNFTQFKWCAQIIGDRVLTLALPRAVEFDACLALRLAAD